MSDTPRDLPLSTHPWPYCQAQGCHNSHTQSYTDYYDLRLDDRGRLVWKIVAHTVTIDGHEMPGWRRWCKTHAMIHEGVAFG
jgi:hypothetical protein